MMFLLVFEFIKCLWGLIGLLSNYHNMPPQAQHIPIRCRRWWCLRGDNGFIRISAGLFTVGVRGWPVFRSKNILEFFQLWPQTPLAFFRLWPPLSSEDALEYFLFQAQHTSWSQVPPTSPPSNLATPSSAFSIPTLNNLCSKVFLTEWIVNVANLLWIFFCCYNIFIRI